MNTLSHGFLFLCGLAWLLGEVCVSAGAGFWTPVWLYLIGFIVMFSIMGCLSLSERAINTAGPIFAAIVGGAIVLYGFGAFGSSVSGGLVRLVGGGSLVFLAVVSFLGRGKEQQHAH